MTKTEFLEQVRCGIEGLPPDDVQRWLEYYAEMLEDRIEEGMSEEEAVAALGEPAWVARQILSQTPLTRLIKNKVKPKRRLRVWEIILIALGSPIWLSVGLALVAVFLSVYAALWSAVVSIWAAELAIAVAAPACVLEFGLQLWGGGVAQAFLFLGAGLVLAGLCRFGFSLCKLLTVWLWRGGKGFLLAVKSLFVGKGAKQ